MNINEVNEGVHGYRATKRLGRGQVRDRGKPPAGGTRDNFR